MLDLNKLNHFAVLARTLNYTHAADELALSQSALTRSIQSLEKSLSLRLLDRSRSGVTLTSAGVDALRIADELLARGKAAEDSMRATAKGSGGRVAFGIGPIAAMHILPKMMAEFETELLGMSVDVRTEIPQILERQLLTGEIDFFLARFPEGGVSPGIEVDWLDKTIPNAIVRREHPLAGSAELDPFELKHFPKVAGHGFKETISRVPDTARRACYQPNIEYDVLGMFYESAAKSDLVLFGAFQTATDVFVNLEIPAIDAAYMVNDVAIFRMEGRTLSRTTVKVQEFVRQNYARIARPASTVR